VMPSAPVQEVIMSCTGALKICFRTRELIFPTAVILSFSILSCENDPFLMDSLHKRNIRYIKENTLLIKSIFFSQHFTKMAFDNNLIIAKSHYISYRDLKRTSQTFYFIIVFFFIKTI